MNIQPTRHTNITNKNATIILIFVHQERFLTHIIDENVHIYGKGILVP
jgi:hypothetical protein